MIYVGIDQSLTFTGVTVYKPDACPEYIFYGITHKKHTKWDKYLKANPLQCNHIKVINFKFEDKVDDYAENERIKYRNISRLVDKINDIIMNIWSDFPDETIEVRMEGVSFGSKQTTAIAELAALNFMIRKVCDDAGITFTILPPTKVKKFATGNGQADKDLMTESFLVLNPNMRPINDVLKLDDIADSFFMASYQE